MELLGEDPQIDAIIFFQALGLFVRRGVGSHMDGIIEATIESARKLPKPMFLALEGVQSMDGAVIRWEAEKKYRQAGIATFPTFVEAARAAWNLSEYRKHLSSTG